MSPVRIVYSLLALYLATLVPRASLGQEGEPMSMRELLTLADVGPQRLSRLPEPQDFVDEDWQLALQVISRLSQFREIGADAEVLSAVPKNWLASESELIGEVFRLEGKVVSVEHIALSDELTELSGNRSVYACRLRFEDGNSSVDHSVDVLTTRIPRAWEPRQTFEEPVLIRGVLAKTSLRSAEQPALVMTDHLAWYPVDHVPSGQRLLARHGMDVTLLDEVKHRQPFVKPSVSREGEAFYAGLKAMGAMDDRELMTAAQQNVAQVAADWRSQQPELTEQLRQANENLAAAESADDRKRLISKARRAKTRRDLSITIARQAEQQQSSVATMFLQPEQEVGELFYFEGTARRAVWISVEEDPDLAGYYELEVYPGESRLLDNRPVVCCVTTLPEDFPVGDQIRVPVRIAGIFFKSWRYRSRELIQREGKTEQARQLYTPVVLGKSPVWLRQATAFGRRGAMWGGIAFLGLLAVVWVSMAGLSKRDQRARKALRPAQVIDIETTKRDMGETG